MVTTARAGAGLLALPALLVLVACGAPAPQAPPAAQRVVAVAPAVVEILFSLGVGDRVVGVGDHVDWPPEAAGRPRLGGLFDPRLEVLAGLRPDLAVLLPSEAPLEEQLEKLGVEVLEVRTETLADVEAAVATIAGRLGVEEAGEEFLAGWRAALAPDPLPTRPRVLLSLGRQPGRPAGVLVAGGGTFLDELLGRLGAVNVFADAGLTYPEVGLEEILRRAPEAILELQPAPGQGSVDVVQGWMPYDQLPAVASGCVRTIAGSHVLLPGPRLPRLYAELRRALDGCGG